MIHRGRLVEWLLALACLFLVLQLAWEPAVRWIQRPRPARLGVLYLANEGEHTSLNTDTLVYLPEAYSEAREWPLLVTLHGSGERGNDIRLVRCEGLPARLEAGFSPAMVVVAPQCREAVDWRSDEVLRLVDRLRDRYAIDSTRVYLSGYSLGGAATWRIAADSPNRFAAIVPISAPSEVSRVAELIDTPAWVFHGGSDSVVPVVEAAKMVDSLNSNGGQCRWTALDGAGHSIWKEVYCRPDLFSWLLRQRLPHASLHGADPPRALAERPPR